MIRGITFVCLAVCIPLDADMVEVELSEAESFTLDVDGDGAPEIMGLAYIEARGDLAFFTYVDGTQGLTTIGERNFRGTTAVSSATIAELEEADGFATEFTPPSDVTRVPEYDSISGYLLTNEARPLAASWTYGTKGTASEPAHLVGIIIDARAFFESEQENPIRIYYHYDGPVVSGGESRWITLADTGIPMPKNALEAEVEHPSPRTICFTVQTEIGMKYRVIRQAADGSREEVLTVEGDGTERNIEWDDSARSDPSALFRLESFGGSEFSPGL